MGDVISKLPESVDSNWARVRDLASHGHLLGAGSHAGSDTDISDVGIVQGSIANGGSTDDTTPTLSGSGATFGDTVNVYDNGNLLGTTQVRTDGTVPIKMPPTAEINKAQSASSTVAGNSEANSVTTGLRFTREAPSSPLMRRPR